MNHMKPKEHSKPKFQNLIKETSTERFDTRPMMDMLGYHRCRKEKALLLKSHQE